jgi:hypothetical protein
MEAGDPADVRNWILNNEHPGLLEIMVTISNYSKLLLDGGPEAIASMWVRLSPVGKEALFEGIYDRVRFSLGQTKLNWLVPLFKEWQFDPSWRDNNIKHLIMVLYYMKNPELIKLIQDVAYSVLDDTELQQKREISYISELLQCLPPGSMKRIQLYPSWYNNLSDQYAIQLDDVLELDIQLSPEHVMLAFEWLAQPHSSLFKDKVMYSIFDRAKPSLFESLDLDGMITRIWPVLSGDDRRNLLYALAKNKEVPKFCIDFLKSIISDPNVGEYEAKHVFLALWRSRQPESVEPILNYLERISQEEKGISPKELALFFDERMDRKYAPSKTPIYNLDFGLLFESQPKDVRPALCIGLIALPPAENPFRVFAARFVEIQDNFGFEIALNAFWGSWDDYEARVDLLGQMGYYALGLGRQEAIKDADRYKKPSMETKDRFIELLEECLKGDRSQKFWYSLQLESLDIIAEYHVEPLIPQVIETALHDPQDKVREKAVSCLGHFLGLETAPVLLECLKDPNEKVQKEAKGILERMRVYEDQKRAWEAFLNGRSGEDSPTSPSEALVEKLNSDDLEVRLMAIRSLGKMGEASALPALLEVMERAETEELREAARKAIEAINAE